MTGIWTQAALVFGLALIATLVSNKFRISTALSEIIVGMAARAFSPSPSAPRFSAFRSPG